MRLDGENGLVGVGAQFNAHTSDSFGDDRLIGNVGTEENALQIGKGTRDVSLKLVHIDNWIVVNLVIAKAQNTHRWHWSDSILFIDTKCPGLQGDVGQILKW